MISYLSGNVITKTDTFIILDVGGVGYKVFVSERTLEKIPENGQDVNPHTKREQGVKNAKFAEGSSRSGVEVKLFCHLHVRESTMDLYGFSSHEELDLFEIIEDISGVGPKASLQIASIGSLHDFKKAIAAQDERFFAGIHGIGRKKIQKIILELTGKIEKLEGGKKGESDEDREVMDALINLGFPRQRAREALSQIPKDAKTTEEKVRAALKVVKG